MDLRGALSRETIFKFLTFKNIERMECDVRVISEQSTISLAMYFEAGLTPIYAELLCSVT